MSKDPLSHIMRTDPSEPFRPEVLDSLRAVANKSMGDEEWEVTYDTGIRSISYTCAHNFRPFYNLRQVFKELTGLGLYDFEKILREGQGFKQHISMVWAWLTFRNDNLPDAGVASKSTKDAKIIAFWDEDAQFIAQFDPHYVLSMIAEIERLKADNHNLAHEVSDGYDAGYSNGSALSKKYKDEADKLRQIIVDIEDELINANAFGDAVDPADILKIISKSKPLPEPESD